MRHNMHALENWLEQATRKLSKDARARVMAEITEHFEAGREAALGEGASTAEADARALRALGDAVAANRLYRQSMLTSTEARMLGEANWEARMICSRPWLKALLLAVPAMAVAASAAILVLRGERGAGAAGMLMLTSLAAMILLAAPFLPVYTPDRARAYRAIKWTALLGLLGVAFGPTSVMLFACLWPIYWIESTRESIRRKLPVQQWPKQLYL